MHMRSTINLDEDLLETARRLTGIQKKTALIHAGFKALIARESALRLAKLGGTEPGLETPPRRRSS